jgi:hypothetical protein
MSIIQLDDKSMRQSSHTMTLDNVFSHHLCSSGGSTITIEEVCLADPLGRSTYLLVLGVNIWTPCKRTNCVINIVQLILVILRHISTSHYLVTSTNQPQLHPSIVRSTWLEVFAHTPDGFCANTFTNPTNDRHSTRLFWVPQISGLGDSISCTNDAIQRLITTGSPLITPSQPPMMKDVHGKSTFV